MSYTEQETRQARIEWVKALRSGDYTRGENSLRRGDTYCCLGVACVINGVGLNPEVNYPLTSIANGAKRGLGTANLSLFVETLPVFEKLNLTLALQSEVSNMNDEGHSFAEIADYIEDFYGLTENDQ